MPVCDIQDVMVDDGDSLAYPEYAERAMYGAAGIGWIEADVLRDGAVKEVRYVAA